MILYSAFADASMTVPAIVAGADGLVHKGVRPQELFEAIRSVAGGGDALPPVSPALLEAAGLHSTRTTSRSSPCCSTGPTPSDIAATLAIHDAELTRRVRRMLERLKVPVPGTCSEWEPRGQPAEAAERTQGSAVPRQRASLGDPPTGLPRARSRR